MQSTMPPFQAASRLVVLALLLVALGGCTANVTSGSFYSVRIGQNRPGVVDGLQEMGVQHVRVVPRAIAIGTSPEAAVAAAAEVDLGQARRRAQLMRGHDETCWEFDYNDRLGKRAVRLEFDDSVLSRIHVRWYPPGLFAAS